MRKPVYHVVWMNKRAPMPAWLARDGGRTHSGRYWLKVWNATPPWARREPVAAIYREAARRRAAGECVHVDHIVPLKGARASGLHWHGNLRIVPALTNLQKLNHHWPGMPMEPQALPIEHTPHQCVLPL